MTGPFSQVSAKAARGAIETARRFVEVVAGLVSRWLNPTGAGRRAKTVIASVLCFKHPSVAGFLREPHDLCASPATGNKNGYSA
jgi:hypothetical protein